MYYLKCDNGCIGVDKSNKPTLYRTHHYAKPFKNEEKAKGFLKNINNKFMRSPHVIFVEIPSEVKDFDFLYKTIKDDPNMGLGNTVCKNPVAFCHHKQVWLTQQDIKKCLSKPDLYGYGTITCKQLKIIK